ncbi:hypothetical protein AHS67_16300 [Salmonella enterica subsp. enterica serovar Enteritidis]|nr:hypothetical protein [Salmonella enterica subsp. enterica serovar Enteritidis]
MKNHITQSQIVYLPYVCAVDPDDYQIGRWITPQIVNEIRSEYGWNNPTTVYRALPDNWREASDNAQ